MTNTWNAPRYDKDANFVSALAVDLVELLEVRPGEHILDLGCGTADLTALIANAGATVLGVDNSEAMLLAAAAKHPGLTFELADGENLQYAARFDAIFSNAALHWMPNAEAVVQGMHRALRPNGRVVAEFGGRGCVACIERACSTILVERGEAPERWFRWFFPSIGQYASILEANGFLPEFARLFPRPTPMPGDDGLKRWLELFSTPLVAHLGSAWPEFASKVAERCRDQLFRDGAWLIDYVRLRIVARRASEPAA